jgi:hypothetical protein
VATCGSTGTLMVSRAKSSCRHDCHLAPLALAACGAIGGQRKFGQPRLANEWASPSALLGGILCERLSKSKPSRERAQRAEVSPEERAVTSGLIMLVRALFGI